MASPLPPTRWEGPVELLADTGAVAATGYARFWRRDDSPWGTAWGGLMEAPSSALPAPAAEPVAVRLPHSGRTGIVRPIAQPQPPTPGTAAAPQGTAQRVEGLGPPPFER